MSQITDITLDELKHITGAAGLTHDHAQLLKNSFDLTNSATQTAIDAVSASGALSLSTMRSELTVSGTKAYTLAAPTFSGQRKIITCVSAASTPLGVLTISSPDTTAGFVCAATFVFTDASQEVELVATPALLWRATKVKRAGKVAVTPGTTVLTGFGLNLQYICAVDGTKAGTTTGGLPNGSSPGERVSVTCSTAANTPIGSLDGVFKDMLGAAATHLGAIGVVASASVVGDTWLGEWDGAAWQTMYQAGVTLS